MASRTFAPLGDENTRYVLLVLAAGLVGSVVGYLFQGGLNLILYLCPGRPENVVEFGESLPVSGRLLIPILGALIAGLIKSAAVRASHETGGPAGVMEIVSLTRRRISLRGVFLKASSAFSSLATGASIGREGPFVSLTTAVTGKLGELARVSDEHYKILTACGLAAGLATAYNTPFAATLFVLEIVIGNFNMRFFGPTVLAALVATVPSRIFLGAPPIYGSGHYVFVSSGEILLYLFLGLLCGLLSVVYLRTLRGATIFFSSFKVPYPVLLGMGALVVGGIGVFYPQVWGNGYSVANAALNGFYPISILLALLLAKMVATSASSGSGTYGGIFTPTLLLGALLGGAFGDTAQVLFPGRVAGEGAYALLGMAGVIAGTLRAPMLAIVMVFEFTGDYAALIPLMVVATIGFYTTSRFEKESVYTEELRAKGLIWEGSPEERVLRGLRVADIVRGDAPVIPEVTPVSQVLEVLLSSRVNSIYVVDSRGRLTGVIDIQDVKNLFREEPAAAAVARDLVRQVPAVTPETGVADAIRQLWDRDPGILPVVDREKSRFMGVVTRRDILAAIDREVLRRNVMLTRFAYPEAREGPDVYFELPAQQEMSVVEVPDNLVGRTIGELQVGSRWGCNVLALTRVRKDGTKLRVLVGAKTRLEDGDQLILMGPPEAIAAFARGEEVGDRKQAGPPD